MYFSSPATSYSWQAGPGSQRGWHCLFTDAFLSDRLIDSVCCPSVMSARYPVFQISASQRLEFSGMFESMQSEIGSTYRYKADLLKSYLSLIVLRAFKMLPDSDGDLTTSAAASLTQSFLRTLEEQFDDYSPDKPLRLTTPGEFARHLCVHRNHLNRSLQLVTGRSTSALINDRITKEAMSLLRAPDWNISQIANSLGFEYHANFHLFFKKQTGIAPIVFRKNV